MSLNSETTAPDSLQVARVISRPLSGGTKGRTEEAYAFLPYGVEVDKDCWGYH